MKYLQYMKNKIFVCHEYYTPSHYTALEYLAKEKGYTVIYCEPNLLRQLRLSVRNKIPRKRFFHNAIYTLILLFTHGYKIIIGIAPYNKFLKTLLWILKGHELYYHSSYSCWDGSRCAHKYNDHDLTVWKDFTQYRIKHFFAVSQKTKDEVVKNGFAKQQNISIVNHSYNLNITLDNLCDFSKTFICVGRICKEKGIIQLLEIFSRHPDCTITFVGKGKLQKEIEKYAIKYKNIKYAGYISGLENLVPIYKRHSFLILNSTRTESWEELFGMTLYEGMACGCIPITTDHPGPKEIISDSINGFICKEGEIEKGLNKAISMNSLQHEQMRHKSIERGQSFHCKNIAKQWLNCFEDD